MIREKSTLISALEQVEREVAAGDDLVGVKLSLAKVTRSLQQAETWSQTQDLRAAMDDVRAALDQQNRPGALRKLRLAIACAMADL